MNAITSLWHSIKRTLGLSAPAKPDLSESDASLIGISVEYDQSNPDLVAFFESRGSYVKRGDLTDEEVRSVLVQSGMSLGRSSDIAFVRRAISDGKEPRKVGNPVPREKLKGLGCRTNFIVTSEFLEILSDSGRAAISEASDTIFRMYLGKLAGINRVNQARHHGVNRVRVIPNNMAAGSCYACRHMSQHVVSIDDAPTGPLSDCPHPGQCAVTFSSVVEIEGLAED